MRPDLYPVQRESTPEHIKKYRMSYRNEPGIRIVHPGLIADVENLDRNSAFGKQSLASEKVDEVVKAQNLNGLADKFN
jgi:hypothetical protein